MTKTQQRKPTTPQPIAYQAVGLIPVSGHRSVLKCRCGGLYLDPDAHHDSFGHHPEPVAAGDAATRPTG
jgi:hypothetical protein